jgi:hypothetical protein
LLVVTVSGAGELSSELMKLAKAAGCASEADACEKRAGVCPGAAGAFIPPNTVGSALLAGAAVTAFTLRQVQFHRQSGATQIQAISGSFTAKELAPVSNRHYRGGSNSASFHVST